LDILAKNNATTEFIDEETYETFPKKSGIILYKSVGLKRALNSVVRLKMNSTYED